MTDTQRTDSRVVLVYLFDLRSHAQIMARVSAQVAVFRQSGLDASAVCMDRELPGDLPPGIEALASRAPRQLRAFSEARRVRRYLEEISPDTVVVRFGFANATLLHLARRFPMILEIHSDDTRELPAQRIIRTYARISNRLFRSRLMTAVRGAMFVSSSLRGLPAFRALAGPQAIVPNGIPVPASPVPAPRNERPVVGYSVGYAASWQGLDRLEALANALPEFDFHLVVPHPAIASSLQTTAVNVIVTEDDVEYGAAIAEFDVALGGLALDRKGISMASALKVRESVAHGIPTLLFSRDEDLDDVDAPTLRTAARGAWNPDDLVAGVRTFVESAVGARVPDELRARVDVVAKAKRYAQLVIEVLDTEATHSVQR